MNNEAEHTSGAMRAAELIQIRFDMHNYIPTDNSTTAGIIVVRNVIARIIDKETGLSDLLATMENALSTIRIMQMPVVEHPANIASNVQLLDIMASSFQATIARAEGNETT